MAASGLSGVNVELIYEDLLAEHKASQQQLHSKDEALKIFQKQLKDSNHHKQRLQQEIKQLHSQLARAQMLADASPSSTPNHSLSPLSTRSPVSRPGAGVYDTEREKYILQLEEAQGKNAELSRQIQLLEDEKEELAGERDYYSGKCTSLVKCLEEERQSKPPSHSALQTVMEENRHLKLDLVEVQAERDQALSRIERYKKAVERRKAREESADKSLQFAMGNKKQDLQLALRRISELETLANSLSESVKEKTISLAHQKKVNKMLASRITELEHRLKVLEISGLWTSTDQLTPSISDPPLTPDRLSGANTNASSDTIEQVQSTAHSTHENNQDTNPFSEVQNQDTNPFTELQDDMTDSLQRDKLLGKKESTRESSSSEEDESDDKTSMVNLA